MTLFSIVPYESHRVAAQGIHDGGCTATTLTATRCRTGTSISSCSTDTVRSGPSAHRFGITDNDLPTWLADQGFQVVPGARANYRATDFSLSSMLSMQMLDEYSIDPGRDSGDRTFARSRLMRPAAAAFLKDNGYTYYQLGSWYGPTQTNELADVTLSWERLDRVRVGPAPVDDPARHRPGARAVPRARAMSSGTTPGPSRSSSSGSSSGCRPCPAASSCSPTSCCLTRRTCSTPTATS